MSKLKKDLDIVITKYLIVLEVVILFNKIFKIKFIYLLTTWSCLKRIDFSSYS